MHKQKSQEVLWSFSIKRAHYCYCWIGYLAISFYHHCVKEYYHWDCCSQDKVSFEVSKILGSLPFSKKRGRIWGRERWRERERRRDRKMSLVVRRRVGKRNMLFCNAVLCFKFGRDCNFKREREKLQAVKMGFVPEISR